MWDISREQVHGVSTELEVVEERQLSLVPQKALASRRTDASRRVMQIDITTIEEVFSLPIKFVPWERLERGHVDHFIHQLQQ